MLTELQKERLRGLEKATSGVFPGTTYDKEKNDAILFGTEAEKLAILADTDAKDRKDLLEHKARLEKELSDINAKLSEIKEVKE